MSDATNGETKRVEGAAGATGSSAGERAGFCQDCGTALTRETIKTVGSGVFCEPCLEKRLTSAPPVPGAAAAGAAGSGAGWGTGYTGSTAYVGSAMPPGGVGATGEPSPALAALLGMIPGVGAVYNGQYAKGLIHFVIFAVLVMFNKDVSDVFGLFVLAWIIYQMVDAHHTAKARRDGHPLPDPFGFNEMGDRMGFGRGWVGSATGPQPGAPKGATAAPVQPPVQPAGDASATWGPPTTQPATSVPPAAAPPTGSAAPPPYAPVPGYPAGQQAGYSVPPANWAGYVHPSAFAAAPPAAAPYTPTAQETAARMAADIHAQALRDAAAGNPYATAANPYAAPYNSTDPAYIVPTPRPHRFPVGALWLIGLGVLVLAKTLTPSWDFNELWIVVGVLAGIALWIFTRRLSYMGGAAALHEGNVPRLVCTLRGPVLMLTLAIMFALQALHLATVGQSWPVLLIVFGVLLVMERTVGMGSVYGGPAAGTGYVPPAAYAAPPSSAVEPVPVPESSETEAAKGGQQ
jgi:hypothetical protein